MKSLITYIDEAFKINKETLMYSHVPNDCKELREIIEEKHRKSPTYLDMRDVDIHKMKELRILHGDTSITGAFANYSKVKVIDVTGWDTSKITRLDCCFWGCKSLEQIIGIEDWDISNVESINALFENCESLTELDLSKWQTDKIIYPEAVFKNCPLTYKSANLIIKNSKYSH